MIVMETRYIDNYLIAENILYKNLFLIKNCKISKDIMSKQLPTRL